MCVFGPVEYVTEVAMNLEMIVPARLLDLLEDEDIEEEGVADVLADEYSADLVIEELFGDGEDLAGEVAVADDHLNSIFVPIIVHVLFYIILVRIEPLRTIFRTQLYV